MGLLAALFLGGSVLSKGKKRRYKKNSLSCFYIISQLSIITYQVVLITVGAIQQVFRLLSFIINKVHTISKKKKPVLVKPVSPKVKSKSVPSNVILFSKYQKHSIS